MNIYKNDPVIIFNDVERHGNALSLGLTHVNHDQYQLPDFWGFPGCSVDLSATGKEPIQIMKTCCTQLAQRLNEAQHDFTKGYTCCVASFMSMYDETTYGQEMYQCNFHSVAELETMGVEQHDIETLKPIIALIEARHERDKATDKKSDKSKSKP